MLKLISILTLTTSVLLSITLTTTSAKSNNNWAKPTTNWAENHNSDKRANWTDKEKRDERNAQWHKKNDRSADYKRFQRDGLDMSKIDGLTTNGLSGQNIKNRVKTLEAKNKEKFQSIQECEAKAETKAAKKSCWEVKNGVPKADFYKNINTTLRASDIKKLEKYKGTFDEKLGELYY